ncbi:hypothetical protein LCGC14_1249390 [marine sediment metagenome]|uniref:ABC3 transporter permease protein domain-containing protein n=1 Tax=marine sediment metagenome TaxID=412755 RepID=A0A0F9P7H2_9ZZZZ
MFVQLAAKSLWSRKSSVLLTLLAISVSVFVLLGIDHVRYQTKQSFSQTVSGVDLIVGARTGDINLLLYSVFRLGDATNNIGWNTYQTIANNDSVAWTIPLSLGDSHQGYRVLGTTKDYFTHFHYGQNQSLVFKEGREFTSPFDVVLGSEVAKKLGYHIGSTLVLAHGIAKHSFTIHKDNPFTVVGILQPTGTPVDDTLHVSLAGIEAIHTDWNNGVPAAHSSAHHDVSNVDLTPKSITAFMVGLNSKMATFKLQRAINDYQKEAVMAILPGVTLTKLWSMMRVLEQSLRLVSALVLVAALLGLGAMLLASMRERRSEISIMRCLGASPSFIFSLVLIEALLITFVACIIAVVTLVSLLGIGKDFVLDQFGLMLTMNIFNQQTMVLLTMVLASALLVSVIPAISAYRQALHGSLNQS